MISANPPPRQMELTGHACATNWLLPDDGDEIIVDCSDNAAVLTLASSRPLFRSSVGYALNPKKLRKSSLDDASVLTTGLGLPLEQSSEQSSTIQSPSSGSSQLQLSPRINSSGSVWRGGGLSDIISDGLECEGVKFIPWNYEVPISLQVRSQHSSLSATPLLPCLLSVWIWRERVCVRGRLWGRERWLREIV